VKIREFDPSDSKQTNLTKIPTDVDLSRWLSLDDILGGDNWTQDKNLCKKMFALFKKEMNNDEIDYSSKTTTKKRARGGKTTSTKQNTRKRKKQTKKSKRQLGSDDDSDYVE